MHALSDKVAFGVGVDFNAKCINAANALKAINRRDNIHFYTFDLDKEDLSMLRHFVFGEPVDVCLFFNISIWVKRWKQAFLLCADLTDTMMFEAHGSDEQQAEQMSFVRSIYADIKLVSEQSDDDPTYAKRKMYVCKTKVQKSLGENTHAASEFRSVHTESTIKEAYESVFTGEVVKSIRVFPNTHESTVAEINADYIVKLPKPHRGINGVRAEQSLTDFLREKVQLPIPELNLYVSPVVLARYLKLPGVTFDKNIYDKLTDKQKSTLAAQLAQFVADLHSIPKSVIESAGLELTPSWTIKEDLIQEQLAENKDSVIGALFSEVLRNQKALEVPSSNIMLGHFDLHGGNLLFNQAHTSITGVIDFGNCKLGDLHQDLSTMNLSSPDFTSRMIECYEQITNKKVNRLLIQHYTTIFYLNLLAGLKQKNNNDKYSYWLGELHRWYDYLISERANVKLAARTPATTLGAGWRKWIAANLIRGGSISTVQNILREQGFSHIDIAVEIKLATDHPYIQAGQEIFHTLKKREWLLNTSDGLARLDANYSKDIEVRDTPSFDVFIKEYYSKHRPVVLRHGIDQWPALEKWSPEYLLTHYGDKEIEVQFGRNSDPLFERNAGKLKKKTLMRDYIEMIRSGGETNDYYMTANNTKNSLAHIAALFDDLGNFGDGYRKLDDSNAGTFFWFGPKGTYTPLHHDLTNNMLVQILGRKKVTLIPAWQVPFLYNDKGVYSAANYPDFDEKRHPLMRNLTPLEIIIHPGDAIFIPIGWWHCVESLDVSMSVTFHDFKAPNQFAAEFPKG